MKKSLKKQAVFPVLMLLVVTALALIGSSFAWFAMTNIANVTAIDTEAEAGSTGLMISADGDNYVGTVTLGDSLSADKKTQRSTSYIVPSALHQVSTADGINFFEASIVSKNSSGVVSTITSSADASHPAANIKAAACTLPDGKTAHIMVFDLYFQIEVANAHLYLNAGSSVVTRDDKSAQNAIRVAFLNMGNSANTTGAKGLNGDPSVIIWKPVNDNRSTFGIISEEDQPFNAYSLVGETTLANGEHTDLVLASDSTVASETPIADIANGYNKIRVLIWLEGQDEDCVLDIARGAIRVTLNFYAAEYTPAP